MKFLLILFGLFTSAQAHATFELGGAFSFQKSTYNGGSYTHEKSWNGSLGYYFTEESEFELMYQETITDEVVQNVQATTNHDRVYSANLVIHFADKDSAFKPYVRGGVGQLNRDATGTYQGGYAPPGRLDRVTVIMGIGLKIKLASHFGLKAEAISYLSGGNISTWKDNVNMSFGGSLYF